MIEVKKRKHEGGERKWKKRSKGTEVLILHERGKEERKQGRKKKRSNGLRL